MFQRVGLFCLLLLGLSQAARAGDPFVDWTLRIDVDGGPDELNAITSYGSDYYVVGSSRRGSSANYDAVLMRITFSGVILWTRFLASDSNGDAAYAITTSTGDPVVAAVTTANGAASSSMTVAKFTANGALVWQSYYDGAPQLADTPNAIDSDINGNFYVGGRTRKLTHWDGAIAKFDKDGIFQWSRIISGTDPDGNDEVTDLVVDVSSPGLLAFTGYVENAGTGRDVHYGSYDLAGNANPTLTESGSSGFNEQGSKIMLMLGGQFVIGGSRAWDANSDLNIFARTATLRATASQSWFSHYNGPASGPDTFGAMDHIAGSTYIAGTSLQSAANGSGWVMQKLSPAGANLWTARKDISGTNSNAAVGIGADIWGYSFVTGWDDKGAAAGKDALTLKLGPNGAALWTKQYSGDYGDDTPKVLLRDFYGNCVIGGTTQDAEDTDMFLIRYRQPATTANDAFECWEGSAVHATEPPNTLTSNDTHWIGSTTLFHQMPEHGSIYPDGTVGEFTYVPDHDFVGTDTFLYSLPKEQFASNVSTATITVKPVPVSNLTLSPTTLFGGAQTLATITVAQPAGSGGFVVDLSDNSSAITTPASTTILVGQTSRSVSIPTLPVSSLVTRTITATRRGVSKTASLTLKPGGLISLTLTPSSVIGGQSSVGEVTLSGPAPAGGRVLNLGDTGGVSTPPNVTVPAGQTKATFPVDTVAVPNQLVVQVYATLDSILKEAPITVKTGYVLVGLAINPSSLTGGQNALGVVTLNQNAPAGGITVTLTDDSGAIGTPASVVVPAGNKTASFTITTSTVTQTYTRYITATYNASIKKPITITP